jgi:hypothetical protein
MEMAGYRPADLPTRIYSAPSPWLNAGGTNGIAKTLPPLNPLPVNRPYTPTIMPNLPTPTVQSPVATPTLDLGRIFGGVFDFFGGLFSSPGSNGGQAPNTGFDFGTLMMMMMLFGGNNRRGGFWQMLQMMMMMQFMPAGGITGGALANPIVAMMLPRLGQTKAMLLGGPELAMTQMMLKPRPQRRRRYYRRRYYRRRWY